MTRRGALRGAVATGAVVPLVSACGEDDDETAVDPPATRESDQSESSGGPAAGEPLGTTADVAVGACFVYSEQKVVVTQPSEGDFRAFSSVCTHQGCEVSSSDEGDIPCKCHFSRFSLEDGSVLDGPAEKALPEVAITVEGDSISLA